MVGVDLDDVRDATTGELHPEAQRIITSIDSYTELSPSGRGVHVLAFGAPLPDDGWKKLTPGKWQLAGEMYSSGRYFTLTGHRMTETPLTINVRSAQLAAFHARVTADLASSAPQRNGNGHHPTVTGTLEDQELLERARRANNGAKFARLYDDPAGPGDDDSSLDMQLCSILAFWTRRDGGQMDRLFRGSACHRPKWDQKHGALTYGAMTIAKAIEWCADVYDPNRSSVSMAPEPAAASPDPASAGWRLYDAADEWTFKAPAFAVEQLLPLKGVTWLGGLPKAGKSLLALYTCLAIASGREKLADHFTIRERPRILYVAREDGGERLKDRREDILSAWPERPAPGSLRFLIRPRLSLLEPDAIGWLRETCAREGIGLLVLDTWIALSPGADPMGAKDQAALSATVVALAEAIEGAVWVVDHSRKNRADGQPLSSADIFGPLQKWAAAEHILMVEATADRNRIELFIEGKDTETDRMLLAVAARGTGTEKFTHAGSVAELAANQRAVGSSNREAVRAALLDAAPRELTADEVQRAAEQRGVSLKVDTVVRHLQALVKAGESRKTGQGRSTRYRAVPESRMEPSSEIPSEEDGMLFAVRS